MKTITQALFLWFVLLAGASPWAAAGGFLFVTFKGEQTPISEQIYFALSPDGCHWHALNGSQPVLTSKLGEKGVRDPYLVRDRPAKRFISSPPTFPSTSITTGTAPTHAGSKSIVIWDSTDLGDTGRRRGWPRSPPDDAGCTWAPEAVYDEGRKAYLAFWASTTGSDNFNKHRIWAAWTKDFVAFDKPFVYLDKPWHVIDADIVRDSGRYYRFSKDDQYKSILMEVSTDLMGPWKDVANFSLAKLRGYEGPECYCLKPAADGKPATWCSDPRPVPRRRRLSALCHPRPGRRAIQARRGLCLSVPVPSRLRAADLSDGIRTPRNSIQGDAMNYRPLGRTGWNVSEISFGAWAIGGAWGEVSDDVSLAALHAAVDAGVNFLDTADVYGDGRSER